MCAIVTLSLKATYLLTYLLIYSTTGPRHALRSKVKVTQLSNALVSWVCRSIWLLRFLVMLCAIFLRVHHSCWSMNMAIICHAVNLKPCMCSCLIPRHTISHQSYINHGFRRHDLQSKSQSEVAVVEVICYSRKVHSYRWTSQFCSVWYALKHIRFSEVATRSSAVAGENRILGGRAHWRHMTNTVERLCEAAINGSITIGVATWPVPKLL